MAMDLVTPVTALPAEMRAALVHLGDRERQALHHIRDQIDLRDAEVIVIP